MKESNNSSFRLVAAASTVLMLFCGCTLPFCGGTPDDVVIENSRFRLVVGADAIPKSLVVKETGRECLVRDESVPLFAVTQERPFNNEIKLIYPHKRTTYRANSLRREGDRLVVGFEIAPYGAEVEVVEKPEYVELKLKSFLVDHKLHYGSLKMDLPPVDSFRVAQLPLKEKKNFGEWLNVMWDDDAAVGVIATEPETFIDSERRGSHRILSAELRRGYHLKGGSAAIVAGAGEKDFLDCVDEVERAYGLPLGVESRRSDLINASMFWVSDLTPANVDKYLEYAKKGGFRLMLLYYTCFVKEDGSWSLDGNWDYRPEYPNGREDVVKLLEKIKAAGIIPGIHFLHTHVGMKTRYVTPVADHRLNLTRRFRLAKEFADGDTELFVEENPIDAASYEGCRILRFGGELFSYEGFTTEWPFKFTGVKRGAWGTKAAAHPKGEFGGVLDMSEYGMPMSCYVDERTSLQDEIADKIAAVYSAGFRFVYMDGSEGVNAPYEYNVPYAQYRVWRKLKPAPILGEAAAKAHFDWHMLSGANAFDIFRPEVFKEKIVEFPQAEAPLMRQDMSRLNFGWWGFWCPKLEADDSDKRPVTIGTQPDMWEFGTSRAAAWDCPMTIQMYLLTLAKHPRVDDVFEVIRRWEDVRVKKWLTQEQKDELKSATQEHHLLVNEQGEYELVPVKMLETADKRIRGFVFKRNGDTWVAYWNAYAGDVEVEVSLPAEDVEVVREPGAVAEPVRQVDDGVAVPASHRRYLKTSLSESKVEEAFRTARIR